ncbi:sensor histidine kinase [Nocardioides renjunii]|uniref:sensor histidine kinase n=1 Tax=Nocardioides renjunii TaxID=3095075 RepID=UPI002AFEDE3D|nr:HAMP domain-containing sensor histidine kinase [Nocardioides sp. S-34]WQQ21611.1 HAMP domain-containing sensor histidine kinase [Nocardioides sp. S-34]
MPRTLTARLVAVAVLLVAVTALLIGTATTLAMKRNLDAQLDAQATESLVRTVNAPRGGPGDDGGPDGDGDGFDPFRDILRQDEGALVAVVPEEGELTGAVRSEGDGESYGVAEPLSERQLESLHDDMPYAEYEPATVRIPELGSYRVVCHEGEGGWVVVGLPTADVSRTISDLVRFELLATLLGVAAAAVAGTVVVRRQLAPLREVSATAHRVAELPLASGEIDMADRVPERLTDERTEIGQVGAALNTMLDHVEAALGQRHRSEQQVRQFVADASHELRTPLATIAGYTELARRRPEATGTALAKVETESARMTALVEDLLLLARLDAGRPLAREPVDLSRLLLEAVDDARVVDPERSWRLVLPDAPLTVVGDGARLHQVVSNLLTNARKYTPPGSTVTVTGTAAGFTVHDDGPGFPPDLAPRAFERFVRGDAARHRAGGAGLGLSLVEAIVASHGGSVALSSRPGGTTLTVRLPSPSG